MLQSRKKEALKFIWNIFPFILFILILVLSSFNMHTLKRYIFLQWNKYFNITMYITIFSYTHFLHAMWKSIYILSFLFYCNSLLQFHNKMSYLSKLNMKFNLVVSLKCIFYFMYGVSNKTEHKYWFRKTFRENLKSDSEAIKRFFLFNFFHF